MKSLRELDSLLNPINNRIADIQQNIDQGRPATPAPTIPPTPKTDPLAGAVTPAPAPNPK